MNRKKLHFIHLGPDIPIVPVKHFSRLPLTKDQMAQAWGICGPSVERNLLKGAPLWEIITAAYLEGLNHGAGIVTQQLTPPPEPKQLELL